MKPKSSALHVCAEPHDAESADLDETADLPALFLPGNPEDFNDDDAGPAPAPEQAQSAELVEVGESINKNLERIAVALEKLQTSRSRSAKVRAAGTKSKKSAKKSTVKRKTARKKAAKKTKRAS